MEKIFQKTKRVIEEHSVLSLFIIMFITAVVVYYPCLFQKQLFIYSDIGSDTENVYYPFFMSLARKISKGDFSMWDFTYGTGTNILTRQADVGSVFTWITCFFGMKYVKYLLVVIQILKIFLAGFACRFYLNNFKISACSKVIVSYIYAFNGFIILWGQHYFFASASIYIVLLLGAIEKAFTSKKGYIYTILVSFITLLTSYYLGYMILLFSGVYAVFRVLRKYTFKQRKEAVCKLGGLLCAVVIGGLMSACLFLPAVGLTLNSSDRLMTDMTFFEKIIDCFDTYASRYDNTTLLGIVSRMFSNNLMGAQDYIGPSNYYEMPQFYFSCLNVFIGIIYVIEIVINRSEKIKIKVLKIIELVLIGYMIISPLFSVVFNGFVVPTFRYTFIVMPLLALCYAEILDKIFHQKLKYKFIEICSACIISIAVLTAVAYKINTESLKGQQLVKSYLITIVIFSFIALYMQYVSRKSMKWFVALLGCFIVVALNVCVESYTTTNFRMKSSQAHANIYITSGNEDVAEALVFLEEHDSTFYRVEKTFTDICALFNDSMIEGYYGVSTYNSVLNRNLKRFAKEICPEICTLGMDGYNDFKGIKNDVEVVSILGIKYILSYEKIEDIPQYKLIHSVNNLHVYENTVTQGIGSFYTNVITAKDYSELSEEKKCGLLYDTLILEKIEQKISNEGQTGKSEVLFEKPRNSSLITGEVKAQQEGYVFAAIPFEDGWKAYVDGEETEIIKANIGYSAIRVKEGRHKIVFQYSTPFLKEGMIISAIGFVCLGIWTVISLRGMRKERKINDSF